MRTQSKVSLLAGGVVLTEKAVELPPLEIISEAHYSSSPRKLVKTPDRIKMEVEAIPADFNVFEASRNQLLAMVYPDESALLVWGSVELGSSSNQVVIKITNKRGPDEVGPEFVWPPGSYDEEPDEAVL